MLAQYIENKKQLTAALLVKDTFDRFELVNGTVTTYAAFSVDGQWHAKFFPDEENADKSREYTPWSTVKPFFLSVIRGKNTPLSFQFVFRLPDDDMQALLLEESLPENMDNVSGMLLNISFDGTSILITTGISHKTFSMDRSAERAWDSYILRFLEKM